MFELNLRKATVLSHQEIDSAHVLPALLRHGVSGPLCAVLAEHGVTYDDARQRMLTELSGPV